ncbi:MAG: serine protease [Bryobacteraceae bacterium]|nr:MAG: serine protease [Bryobacteraceae bacterium]
MKKQEILFWLRRLAADRRLALSAGLFAAALVIVLGAALTTSVTSARAQAVAPDATPLAIPPAVKSSNEFTRIAEMLEPSVVYITSEYRIRPTTQRRAPRQEEGELDQDENIIPGPFRRFFESPFGQMPQPPRRREGTGSGFIVDRNGYIITNLHVVDRATAIKVRLTGDRTEYKAKMIGSDPELDIAVIKVDAGRPLQPVRIANSDGVQVGEWAIAIGAPFELEKTVTVGIVSALGRDLGTRQQFQRFIQTDAAINPGNSGGPLVNIRGEVIGVNTMIATSSGGYEGIGFALPINTVVKSYNQIIRSGRVVRGSIGIRFPRDEGQIENTLKALGFDHGIIVESVAPGGPAEKAGLQPDDVILTLNGRPVKDGNDLVSRISEMPIGAEAVLEIDRGGKRITKKVIIEERDKVFKEDLEALSGRREMVDPDAGKADESSARFGIGIRPLSEERRKQLGFTQEGGVEVTVVEEDSFAEEIGMRTGDIIVSINRQPVSSFEDVKRIQSSLKRGDAVAFKVMRPAPGPRGQRQWTGVYLSGVLPK